MLLQAAAAAARKHLLKIAFGQTHAAHPTLAKNCQETGVYEAITNT
jgi:hypothetical protein